MSFSWLYRSQNHSQLSGQLCKDRHVVIGSLCLNWKSLLSKAKLSAEIAEIAEMAGSAEPIAPDERIE